MVTLHLFQWTDEYAGSFNGGKLDGGIISHWNNDKLEKLISQLLRRYENRIVDFYTKTSSIDGAIMITEKQIRDSERYNLHHPHPKYILPFLLARNRMFDKSLLALNEVTHLSDDLRNKIEKRLRALQN